MSDRLASIVWPSDLEPYDISVFAAAYRVRRMLFDLHYNGSQGWYWDYAQTQVLPFQPQPENAPYVIGGFGAVTAESPGFASIFVFEGRRNKLWIRSAYKRGEPPKWMWSNWVKLDQPAAGTPSLSAIAAPSGYLGAFTILHDGRLHECAYHGSWKTFAEPENWDWYTHGTPPELGQDAQLNPQCPATIASQSGYTSVFVSAQSYLYERHFREGYGWEEWENLGTPTIIGGGAWSSDLKAVAPPTGYMGVFQQDALGNIHECYVDGERWVWAEHNVPSEGLRTLSADIAAVAAPDGRVFVFSCMEDTTLKQWVLYVLRYDQAQGWRWNVCGHLPPVQISAVSLEAIATRWGYVGVFLRASAGELHECYLIGDESWGWTSHGAIPDVPQPPPDPGYVTDLTDANYLPTIVSASVPMVVLFYTPTSEAYHPSMGMMRQVAHDDAGLATVAQMFVKDTIPEIQYTYRIWLDLQALQPKFAYFKEGRCCRVVSGEQAEDWVKLTLNDLRWNHLECKDYREF